MKYKFKPGDLVLHSIYDNHGLGVIVDIFQHDYEPAYWVYWSKKGLDWHYEELFEGVA